MRKNMQAQNFCRERTKVDCCPVFVVYYTPRHVGAGFENDVGMVCFFFREKMYNKQYKTEIRFSKKIKTFRKVQEWNEGCFCRGSG